MAKSILAAGALAFMQINAQVIAADEVKALGGIPEASSWDMGIHLEMALESIPMIPGTSLDIGETENAIHLMATVGLNIEPDHGVLTAHFSTSTAVQDEFRDSLFDHFEAQFPNK